MDDRISEVRSLYDEHGPALLRSLRRLTGRREVAEDLLQETFVQAMRSLERIGKAHSHRAWLFVVARHLGINALRRTRPTVPLIEAIAATPAAEEDPRLEPMRRAIAELPELQREALQFRLRDKLSYQEIADVLGVPIGTVRSRLHKAVNGLRGRLKTCED